MALNENAVLTSVRGAVFVGPQNALIDKALLAQFSLTAATVGTGDTKFERLGYMSADSLPEFNLDGGDATSQSVWDVQNFRTTYSDTTGTVTLHSVQGDKDFMKTYYGAVAAVGAGVDFSIKKQSVAKSLFIFIVDTNINKNLGMLFPNTDMTFNALPQFNQDSFNLYDLLGTFKPCDKLKKTTAGEMSTCRYFTPEDFTTV